MTTYRLIPRSGLKKYLKWFHFRLFGQSISQNMYDFLGHLSWSFIGGGLASAIMLAVTILVGRVLGPAGYGQYSLILTTAQLITTPVLFGIDLTSTRIIAQSTNDIEKRQHASSAFVYVVAANLIVIVLTLSLITPLQRLTNQSAVFILATVIFSASLSIKSILDSILQGMQRFVVQFQSRMLDVTTVVLLLLILFVALQTLTPVAYIVSLMGGTIIFCIRILIYLTLRSTRPSSQALIQQLRFGRIIFLGAVFAAGFNSLDKFLIAKYLNITALGVYSAYFTGSTNLIAQLTQMFLNVFFPSVAASPNKAVVFRKMTHLITLGFLPFTLLLSGLLYVIMHLFGSQYGLDLTLVFSFSFLAGLQFVLTVSVYFITAIGEAIYTRYLITLNAVNLLHLASYGLLILLRNVTLHTIVWLLIANVTINIAVQYLLIRHYFQGRNLQKPLTI